MSGAGLDTASGAGGRSFKGDLGVRSDRGDKASGAGGRLSPAVHGPKEPANRSGHLSAVEQRLRLSSLLAASPIVITISRVSQCATLVQILVKGSECCAHIYRPARPVTASNSIASRVPYLSSRIGQKQ